MISAFTWYVYCIHTVQRTILLPDIKLKVEVETDGTCSKQTVVVDTLVSRFSRERILTLSQVQVHPDLDTRCVPADEDIRIRTYWFTASLGFLKKICLNYSGFH